MSYYIAKIRQFYGPSEQLSIVSDDSGDPEVFDSIAVAKEAIDYFNSGRYDLSNNECSRPDYVIVGQSVIDWLDIDDQGKYEWEDCDCKQGDEGECCGVCDDCVNHMQYQDIKYVRDHEAREGFEIWLVPNGRMDDFKRGRTGAGYPDACKCWGVFDTRDAAIDRLRELAEEESLKEGRGEDFANVVEQPDWDDDDAVKAYDAKVEKRRLAFVEDCVESLGFEWDQDLEWIRVVRRDGDTMEIL